MTLLGCRGAAGACVTYSMVVGRVGAPSQRQMQAQRLGNQSVVLFAVRNDAGHTVSGGIGFAPSGGETSVGELHLRATIGTYPQLLVASATTEGGIGGDLRGC